MNHCQHLSNGLCWKANEPIKINPQFCEKCFSTGTKLIDPLVQRINGTQPERQTAGVGTVLRKLIAWFPIAKRHQCARCSRLEARYNRWGPDECERKIDRIVKRLRLAAQRRKLPITDYLIKQLVLKAIANAKANCQ